MYHNVQSLNAHYEDITAFPCMMNTHILLFSETWTIFKDKFPQDDFNHYHLISHASKRKPNDVSIYVKKDLQNMVDDADIFPNYDMVIHFIVVNFKTKIRLAVLYAKPGSSDDDIFDAIQPYRLQNSLADFNLDVNTTNGKEFCDTMENIYYLKLRNNPSDSTTIHHTTIDCIFSTNIVRTCGIYESAFSSHLTLYVQIPWEKMQVRTPIPSEDNNPMLECGPDLLDRN
ncbi:hypothetical protein HNY73_007613 [Argiope bruennichi]|uniref:Uncharacterized protein n=1 Tax=Argiope bruennichi TaxID=94029 RepID=A0A8T0FH16_ARGBR|nr:hypothetical protein HNY73_007613 [Argiope bruennichi]